MQHYIQFALLLMLATAHLTSPALTGSIKLQSILITPENIRYLANFITSSATIDSRFIRLRSRRGGEKLLEVPIAAAGELDVHASIRVTVGFNPPRTGVDYDPWIGISDGTNVNRFLLVDSTNYHSLAPCWIAEGASENKLVTTRTVPPQFTFLFSPFHKYGTCSSSQDGGYLNVGTFNKQVDPTRGLNFEIYGKDANEQYQFYYVMVEIL